MAKLFNPCQKCREAEAIWHIRANTKFVCNACKLEIEWHTDPVERKKDE